MVSGGATSAWAVKIVVNIAMTAIEVQIHLL
jgi:hypothetical protein